MKLPLNIPNAVLFSVRLPPHLIRSQINNVFYKMAGMFRLECGANGTPTVRQDVKGFYDYRLNACYCNCTSIQRISKIAITRCYEILPESPNVVGLRKS